MSKFDSTVSENLVDRRALIRNIGLGGASFLIGNALVGCGGAGSGPSSTNDANLLNYALNFEYLTAEYYLLATTGTGLSVGDRGANPGTVTGGASVPFVTTAYQQFAAEIAADEQHHVEFLRTALGSSAIGMPTIDFTNAFNTFASAAGFGPTFNPFADETSFLLGAFLLEDLTVTVYRGIVALVNSKVDFFAIAGILGTESYHAATIRTSLFNIGGSAVTTALKISNQRNIYSGSPGDDQGVTSGGNANITPTDANGLVYSRTTTQALDVVYMSATAVPVTGTSTPGGFFPSGLRGGIR